MASKRHIRIKNVELFMQKLDKLEKALLKAVNKDLKEKYKDYLINCGVWSSGLIKPSSYFNRSFARREIELNVKSRQIIMKIMENRLQKKRENKIKAEKLHESFLHGKQFYDEYFFRQLKDIGIKRVEATRAIDKFVFYLKQQIDLDLAREYLEQCDRDSLKIRTI